ncbi:MAG: HAD-IA family hydrolase [Candidatus Roizmanbacteria bacterium]|nr:HAD-IA family hydrolase [Candidatus Roizmanbacteria bacterium]
MIKALIFDFGNVVVTNDWNYICPEKDKEFTSYFGVTMQDFKKGWDIAWPLIRIGKITEDEFWKLFLTESGAKNIDIVYAKTLWRKYQSPLPGMINLIIRLRNRYTLVGCTDNGKEWVEFYKGNYHFDSYFDAIVSSAEVGDHKPNPKIYEVAIEKTGVKPDEILFIDDNDKPLEGAQKARMHTLKFKDAIQLEKDLKSIGIDTDVIDISSREHSFYWQSDRKISELQIKRIFLSRHSFFDEKSAKAAIEFGMKKRVVELIPPIKSGSINSVVKATLDDGTEVIMRMHPNGLKNGYFWAEKTMADAAQKAGVPAYKTYFINTSKKQFPFDYMIISCEKGKNMKNSGPYEPEIDKVLIEDTGRLMALTHSVKTEKYGFFDNEIAKKEGKLVGIHNTWKEHIYASLNDNLDYLISKNAISKDEREKIETIFKNNDHLIVCDSPRLVHNDIADWNQLTDGKKITAFIDWDEGFSGDPICDFSTYSVFFDDVRLANLIRGYETVTKLADDFEEKFHLYRLRYIISKLTLRTKRSMFDTSEFLIYNLKFAQQLLIKPHF